MGFTKYICYHCDTVFDEQDAGWDCEMIGEGSMRGPLWYHTCPKCGSDEYGEARECLACGEYFSDEKSCNLDYCENCSQVAEKAISNCIRKIQEELNIDYETARDIGLAVLERKF